MAYVSWNISTVLGHVFREYIKYTHVYAFHINAV